METSCPVKVCKICLVEKDITSFPACANKSGSKLWRTNWIKKHENREVYQPKAATLAKRLE